MLLPETNMFNIYVFKMSIEIEAFVIEISMIKNNLSLSLI